MTPPTPDIAVSEERVKELRESVRTGRVIISGDAKDLSTLINIVEGYSSLQAENERLKKPIGFHDVDEFYPEEKEPTLGDWKSRAEKAKAENEMLNNNAMNDYAAHLELKARAETAEAEIRYVVHDLSFIQPAANADEWGRRLSEVAAMRLQKAEAQLAKQAPLVNALLRIANEAFPLEVTEKCMRSVARAALALREGAKK